MGWLTSPSSISWPRAAGFGMLRACECVRVRKVSPFPLKITVPSDTLPAKGIWVSTLLLGIDLLTLV